MNIFLKIKFQINKIGTFEIGYLQQIDFENENNTLLEELEKSFSEIKNILLIIWVSKLQKYLFKLNVKLNEKHIFTLHLI